MRLAKIEQKTIKRMFLTLNCYFEFMESYLIFNKNLASELSFAS